MECEQQLLLTVQKLTRQELADRLLDALAAAAVSGGGGSSCFSGCPAAVPAAAPDPGQVAASDRRMQCFPGNAAAGAVISTLPPPAAAAATVAAGASQLLKACHHEELSEALFQLVKTAQQQQQAMPQHGSKGLTRMQALLLKWLILNINNINYTSSSSSSTAMTTTDSNQGGSRSSGRPKGSVHLQSSILPVVTELELQLLTAQLAVKVKRWTVAQAVAGALQQRLTRMVSGDPSGMLIYTGSMCWAIHVRKPSLTL